MKSRMKAPSPSMVVALIALFVALSGVAVAGVTLSNNTVRSNNIVNGQVKNADLATNSVGKAKIRSNAVDSSKIVDGSVTSTDVADGSLGAGDLSPAAQAALKTDTTNFFTKSESNARFLRGTVTIVARSGPIAMGDFGSARADCPAGMQAIGGGVDPTNVFTMSVTGSAPVIEGAPRMTTLTVGQRTAATGWIGFARNESATPPVTVTVAAICAPLG